MKTVSTQSPVSPQTASGDSSKSPAQAALEAIRNNLLRPMHDSLLEKTKETVKNEIQELTKRMTDIEQKLKEAEQRQQAFIEALANLKWET